MPDRVTRLWGGRVRPDGSVCVYAEGSDWGSVPATAIEGLAQDLAQSAMLLGADLSAMLDGPNFDLAEPIVVLSRVVGEDRYGPKTAFYLQAELCFYGPSLDSLKAALRETGIYETARRP